MSRAARLELIRDLRERLSRIERPRPPERGAIFSTGLEALDPLLPRQGLEWGTLVEWLSDGAGAGAATLALAITSGILRQRDSLVVIDGQREFYPPAAAGLGIPLERTVLVRPQSARDALWAWEQSLLSGAVAVVLGWIAELNERAFRKLQLAAETGGSLGFLLRPATCRAESSWAEARLLVHALPTDGLEIRPTVPSSGRRWRVELLYGRGGAGGKAIELELSDEAGPVPLVSRLAHPTSAACQARA